MASELMALTPIDGRYRETVAPLAEYLSEYGLIKARVEIEAALLIMYTSGEFPDVPHIGDEAHKRIKDIVTNFSEVDAEAIKEIEAITNHDVKAVELWMRSKLENDPVVSELLELIHFGATSEDINNNAYNINVSRSMDNVILPIFDEVTGTLGQLAVDNADESLLALTHGQAATPTTLGKEMKVMENRFSETTNNLRNMKYSGKFNSATGNYAAMQTAVPEMDFPDFARRFVESLDSEGRFVFKRATTQIEPHDQLARLLKEVAHADIQITAFAKDFWGYIQRGVFKQISKKGEAGSSIMAHKINPIRFENAESNGETGEGLINTIVHEILVSRFQRDLTDSSTLRNIGTAFGHTAIAGTSLLKGLARIEPNREVMHQELEGNWVVLSELVQTVARRYGEKDPYEVAKKATQGQVLTYEGYVALIDTFPKIPADVKKELYEKTPFQYTGLSKEIALGTELKLPSQPAIEA